MNLIAPIVFFILFVGVICLPIISRYQINRVRKDDVSDDIPIQDEIGEIKYKGITLYLSPDDKNIFTQLPQHAKQEILDTQQRNLFTGKWVKVTIDGKTGILTKEDALKDGFLVRVIHKNQTVLMRRELALKKGLIKQ